LIHFYKRTLSMVKTQRLQVNRRRKTANGQDENVLDKLKKLMAEYRGQCIGQGKLCRLNNEKEIIEKKTETEIDQKMDGPSRNNEKRRVKRSLFSDDHQNSSVNRVLRSKMFQKKKLLTSGKAQLENKKRIVPYSNTNTKTSKTFSSQPKFITSEVSSVSQHVSDNADSPLLENYDYDLQLQRLAHNSPALLRVSPNHLTLLSVSVSSDLHHSTMIPDSGGHLCHSPALNYKEVNARTSSDYPDVSHLNDISDNLFLVQNSCIFESRSVIGVTTTVTTPLSKTDTSFDSEQDMNFLSSFSNQDLDLDCTQEAGQSTCDLNEKQWDKW